MPIEVPPTSIDDVQAILQDKTRLVYLIVADASSDAWTISLAAEQELAGVVSIRFAMRDDAKKWINQDSMVAATSNWGGRIITFLTSSQAEDKDFVLATINRDSSII